MALQLLLAAFAAPPGAMFVRPVRAAHIALELLLAIENSGIDGIDEAGTK